MARPSTYLGFPGTAQTPDLRGTGPATVLSGSQKALGTRIEGWEGKDEEVLSWPSNHLPPCPSRSEYFHGKAKGAW